MGALNSLDTCWKCNTAGPKQSRKFLECIDGYFITEVTDKLTKAGTTLSFTSSQEKKQLDAAFAAVTNSWWHSCMNKDLLTKPRCKKSKHEVEAKSGNTRTCTTAQTRTTCTKG